ncbi:putative ribonuclease H protein [Spatholobus suberectus]|nr:putative ribonuclease H protein [Spatholobus suberectus]
MSVRGRWLIATQGAKVTIWKVMRRVKQVLASCAFEDIELKANSLPQNDHLIRWLPPNINYVKLNTYGVVNLVNGRAFYCGVLHDHNSAFVVGYSANIGCCSITQVES